jgi:hypothetical protein
LCTPAADDEGTLELLDEVVEKTKTMKLTEQAVTSSAASQERPLADAVNSSVDVGAAAASVANKEDAAGRLHQIYHEESAKSKVPVPASLVVAQTTRKKLLVLDLNGLLADINQDFHNAHLSHARCRGKLGKLALGCLGLLSSSSCPSQFASCKFVPPMAYAMLYIIHLTQIANFKVICSVYDLYLVLRTPVFKRPFCDDFLKFFFHNFELGVWSSRLRCKLNLFFLPIAYCCNLMIC